MSNIPPYNCEINNTQNVVIYTSTFYNDSEESNVRAKLCIKFLKNAQELGIKCVVSEWWSTNQEFLNELKSLRNITVVESNKWMWEDRRTWLKVAMEENPTSKYFLWSEPEKDDLITPEHIQTLIQWADDWGYDIIVPKREKNDGRPEFQKWIEDRANQRVYNELRKQWVQLEDVYDLWFWPKVFTQKWAQYFLNYQGKLDKWDSIIKPVVDALRDGIKVWSITINYKYDETQIDNEADPENRSIRDKRVSQYRAILMEILWDNTPLL